jgi:EmrB/QacA subfamily drug resistance transporter
MTSSSPGPRWHIAEPAPAALLARQSYYQWLIVGVTCIGAFIGQLDGSIVQLALPALSQAFNVSVDDVRWVAIVYPLFFAAFLPVVGRVCDIYGRKHIYLLGFALFSIASLLSGFATSLETLVLLRIAQGIGGAMLGANSMTILMKSIAIERRGQAIGLYTTAQAVGVCTGPLVGGLLLQALGWQWIFWVTVPFGLAATIAGWLILPITHDVVRGRPFDFAGALFVVPSLLLTILVLNQTSVWPLASPKMLLCVAATAIFFALFLRRERVAPWPLIDLTLLRHRVFTAGSLGVALGYALIFSMFFLMSFALIHGFHNSPRLAGVKLAVIPIAIGLFAPVGIALSGRLGSRLVRVCGMALTAAAVLALSAIAVHPIGSLVSGLSAFAVFGIGLGLFMAPNNHATLEAAPASYATQAASLLNLVRVFGGCVGVSIASSMMSWRMAQFDAYFGGRPLIDAIESSLAVLVVFALAAIAATLVRPRRPA